MNAPNLTPTAYACPHCGREYTSPAMRRQHLEDTHRETVPAPLSDMQAASLFVRAYATRRGQQEARR